MGESGQTYWQVWDDGTTGYVRLPDEGDWRLAERVWAAAHEAGLVEGWEPLEFVFGGAPGGGGPRGFDAIQAVEEFHVYSEDFRAAVDSCRTDVDRYQWLPVVVRDASADQCWDYFILNVDGPDVCSRLGDVDPRLAAGRTVVLCGIGDNPPVFSSRAKQALEGACVHLTYTPVEPIGR